jgi:hypothetical protein
MVLFVVIHDRFDDRLATRFLVRPEDEHEHHRGHGQGNAGEQEPALKIGHAGNGTPRPQAYLWPYFSKDTFQSPRPSHSGRDFGLWLTSTTSPTRKFS